MAKATRTATKAAPKSAANANTVISSKGAAPGKGAAASRGAKAGKTGEQAPKDSLEKILRDQLKDIYYAEKKLEKALGKMAKNAAHTELSEAFLTHRDQTTAQIEKLNGAFEMLGMKPQAKKCPAMDGLVEEGNETMEEYGKGAGRDAAMIVSAQKCEHYEIAAYGSLRTFAITLGHVELAQVFEGILGEESETDEILTQLAHTINEDAVAGSNNSGGGSSNGIAL